MSRRNDRHRRAQHDAELRTALAHALRPRASGWNVTASLIVGIIRVIDMIGRLWWRYRSELAPFTTGLLVLVAGAWLHATHPHAWWIVLLVTSALAAVAWFLGERVRLDRAVERAYAASVIGLAGVWTALVDALGLTRWLWWVLLAGVVIAGIPWWVHRRRRAKVKVVRAVKNWERTSEAVSLPGSRLQSARVDAWGWTARLVLRPGMTVAQVLARIPELESALRLRPGSIRVEPDPKAAHRARLRVIQIDPHAQALSWPGPGSTTVTKPITVGLYEDAEPIEVSMRRHTLIAGMSGSGKSGVLNAIIGDLAACLDVVLWGCDLKFGLEIGPWAPVFDRVATDATQARALLADAIAAMEARGTLLAERGKRDWAPSSGAPDLVVVIDEVAQLSEDATAIAHVERIATQGRALGVRLLIATQYPTIEALGSSVLRAQMDNKICLRVERKGHVNVVFGEGAVTDGWNAHAIPASKPGGLYLKAPGAEYPRLGRAYLVTDALVAATVVRYRDSRPSLDSLSAAAAGSAINTSDADRPDLRLVKGVDLTEDSAGEVTESDPDAALWQALEAAGTTGTSIVALMKATGLSRSWVYKRLHAWAADGLVANVGRGSWAALTATRPADGSVEATGTGDTSDAD